MTLANSRGGGSGRLPAVIRVCSLVAQFDIPILTNRCPARPYLKPHYRHVTPSHVVLASLREYLLFRWALLPEIVLRQARSGTLIIPGASAG